MKTDEEHEYGERSRKPDLDFERFEELKFACRLLLSIGNDIEEYF